MGSLARLLFWHWLQPALYFAVLACHWAELDGWQHFFGIAVGVREGSYVQSTLVALWLNPAFLPVDVGATVREREAPLAFHGLQFLLMYAFTPEKFVASAAFGYNGLHDFRLLALTGLAGFMLDLCSVGGLVTMLFTEGALVPALLVSYATTGVAAVLFLYGLIDTQLFHGTCTNKCPTF